MNLELILGPMYSGKTSYIINIYKNIRNNNKDFMCYKPKIDNRYSNNEIVSHDSIKIPCISTESLLEDLKNKNLNNYKNILIDEGQFYKDLLEGINYLITKKYNGNIYISGLNGDFKKNKIGNILDLIPKANNVIFLRGICNICKNNKSSFSLKTSYGKNQIEIGGSEMYKGVCGNCYRDSL